MGSEAATGAGTGVTVTVGAVVVMRGTEAAAVVEALAGVAARGVGRDVDVFNSAKRREYSVTS